MQRDDKRVRPGAWGPALAGDPWLALSAVISVGFFVALYAYGVVSCRPGGEMWETIARYEGKEMLNMTGTWLALPLAALKSNYGRLYSKTCGGTVGGRRPAPSLDMLVCVPVEDVKAEETWTLWKDSFSSLVLMFSVFILGSHAIRSEGERLLERRWRFYLASGFGFMFAGHGLLGGLAMLAIVLANFGLARATARLPLGVAQGVAWAFALLSMEAVFRLLGDHAHRVGGSDEEQGVKYWSLLEAIVCGEDALRSPDSGGTSCRLHQPFVLKGLCPWFLYRFVALKLVSFSLDFAWTVRAVPSRVRALEDKPELVQRTEKNLPLEKYGLQQYLCYVFYVPTYATGPILSYNAFVSQVEEEQKSYSRKDLLSFGLRLILFIVLIEAFSVVWWYSQKLHPMSCMLGGLYEQCIFDDLSVWELFLATHVRLHFTWLQLLIIWRFGRMVALLDGIDTPENMLGCVSFNYTFEAFWRIWHSSMNRFMLRYLYNPLGGKARSWLAVPLVFTFVAYWHENTGFMTRPWWYFWGLMNAVGVTAEKALADSLGKSLARAASSGRWQGKCLQLLARGCGPLALIAVNLPALLFASTPHFYASLFWRGWPSLLLVASLVVVYGCNAELVEALREGKGPAPPAARDLAGPASGARVAPPLPPPPASPRPSEVAVAGEVEAGLSPRQRRCSDVALPRRSFEAERQDSLLVELEDISLSSTASWRSAAYSLRPPPSTSRSRGSFAVQMQDLTSDLLPVLSDEDMMCDEELQSALAQSAEAAGKGVSLTQPFVPGTATPLGPDAQSGAMFSANEGNAATSDPGQESFAKNRKARVMKPFFDKKANRKSSESKNYLVQDISSNEG